ncbi:MAG: cytochrome d ubiquinol oxidase subunit II [Myxococcales bacterium]|nr:cytochrome d ubiquinol oxidase subunit II [Myxococcales bacterium]
MAPELIITGVIGAALILYTLTAGADFGGGVWDLLARGPRAADQRRVIAEAIAPIWEANHVWLILVVVLLFVCFPAAFAAISTALHIPLTLMLVGVVLRGSAFTFRAYDPKPGAGARRWSQVFAVASLITPITLGVTLGAVSGGFERDPVSGLVQTDFISSWLAPYPLAVGLFTLVLFAFLAAVYLVEETDDEALRAIFRRRGLASGIAVGVAALIAFIAAEGAPEIREGLAEAPWAPLLHGLTGVAAVTALVAIWRRRDRLARLAAMAQATLIVAGWGLAQYPYLAVPGYRIDEVAAPEGVLWPVIGALAAGAVLLVPTLWYLFAVFKRSRAGRVSQPH